MHVTCDGNLELEPPLAALAGMKLHPSNRSAGANGVDEFVVWARGVGWHALIRRLVHGCPFREKQSVFVPFQS